MKIKSIPYYVHELRTNPLAKPNVFLSLGKAIAALYSVDIGWAMSHAFKDTRLSRLSDKEFLSLVITCSGLIQEALVTNKLSSEAIAYAQMDRPVLELLGCVLDTDGNVIRFSGQMR